VEEGQLPGHDPEEMIQTDQDEAASKHLRCVYLTEKPPDRPKALYDAISRQDFTPGTGSTEGMINADSEDLSDLERFGRDWQAFLIRKGKEEPATRLLREGARLFNDTQGLERLALEKGRQYPGLFVDWLNALEQEKKHRSMIDAALIGLETVPNNLTIRADIADSLRNAATVLHDQKLVLRSLKEALHASPSLERLLDFVDSAKSKKERSQFLDGAIARFWEIEKRSARSVRTDFESSPDLFESGVPKHLELICRILKGDFAFLPALMDRSGPLGWYFGDNPNRIAVPFSLLAGWNCEEPLKPNLAKLLESMASDGGRFADLDHWADDEEDFNVENVAAADDPQRRLKAWLERTIAEIPIPEKDRVAYFQCAVKAVEKRTGAILSGKHRKSYWKAAQLTAAVAETDWSNGRPTAGQELIDMYLKKYNRYPAFKRELARAVKKSGLFAVRS